MLLSKIMNKIPQNYVVSSAGWDIPIDHIDPYGAAVNGVACALNSFGASTLISTTVMVSKRANISEMISPILTSLPPMTYLEI